MVPEPSEPGEAPAAADIADARGSDDDVTPTVAVQIELDEPSVVADLSAPAGPAGDPFGDFATCSGVRGAVGTYVVGVGASSGTVRWASVVTATRLEGPGTVDADVRIELADGTSVEATGTTTIATDLASGSFIAFDAAGSRVSGTFDCRGGSAPPTLIAESPDGAIEVLALLRRSGAERVVSAARVGATAEDCPLGVDSPTILTIDGDESLGAITTFELTDDGTTGALRLRIGDYVEEFDDVDVSVSDTSRAGTFGAVRGDLALDGAFSCT